MEITIQQNTQYGLVVSSRVIAKELGKRHSDVLRALTEILTDANLRSLIISSNYKDKKRRREKRIPTYKRWFYTLYV